MKENKLVELSKEFAVDIVNLCTKIKENRKGNILLNQLLRSGTSIGANVREAVRGQSKPDFYSKLGIALKEAEETEYWLELLHESEYISTKQFESIYCDCDELIKLLVSITKTQKNNNS